MPHEKPKSKSLPKAQMSTVQVPPEFGAEAGLKWLRSLSNREKEDHSARMRFPRSQVMHR